MSDRKKLPKRFIDDQAALETLLKSAATLDGFAKALAPDAAAPAGFELQKGRLPWPVLGRAVLQPKEPDAKGVKKPGLTLGTRALALVTSPWAATVRYVGPLLDYGNVMILEPGDGYLIVLAGMDSVYVETGDVVGAGAPLGLMGGAKGQDADLLTQQGGGAEVTETLYLELRQGARPIDPTDWFGPTEG
jgi:murein hydrolase activator